MPARAVTVFAVSVVAFVALSAWLDRRRFGAPVVFTLVGGMLAVVEAHAPVSTSALQALTQTTLALILFHDAAQVRPAQLRRDAGIAARLLLAGLPLTVLLGFAAAKVLMPGGTGWLALFLAAALAPTDAGLGAATVLNPVVPARVRRVLAVESGLNDGLVTPVVLLAVAELGTSEPAREAEAFTALRELAIGVVAGVVAGAAVGKALAGSEHRGLACEAWIPLAVLMVPVLAYGAAATMGGNGFIAAFVSGTAFAAVHTGPPLVPATRSAAVDRSVHLSDSVSTLLGYAVWMVFGIEALPHLWRWFSWQGLVFAVLSLTVFRMGPVALALAGTGLRWTTVVFIGWFGPRGLASVVFLLIALRSAPPPGSLAPVAAVVELTVLLSVILHGTTAGPWAGRYGAWISRSRARVENQA